MDESTRIAVCFLTLGFTFALISDVFLDVLRAHEEMHWVMFLLLLQRVFLLGLGLYGLWRGWGLVWLVSVYVFVYLIHLLNSWKLVQHLKGRFCYSFDWRFTISIFRQSWAFALSNVLGALNFRLGIYLLSFLKGNVAVGYYGAAHRLVEALIFIPLAITTASFPNFSRLFRVSSNQLKEGASAVLKMLFIISLPIALVTTLFAKQIILLTFGESFKNSVFSLQILIWVGFFIFLNCLYMALLQAMDRHRQVAILMGGCLLLHLILNFFLIPLLSETGAAISALITEVVLGISFLFALAQRLNIISWFQQCAKPIIAGICMVFLLVILHQLNFFLVIVLGALSYGAALILLKPFTQHEISWLKTAVPAK